MYTRRERLQLFDRYHGYKLLTLFQKGQYFAATYQQQLSRLPTTVSTLKALHWSIRCWSFTLSQPVPLLQATSPKEKVEYDPDRVHSWLSASLPCSHYRCWKDAVTTVRLERRQPPGVCFCTVTNRQVSALPIDFFSTCRSGKQKNQANIGRRPWVTAFTLKE